MKKIETKSITLRTNLTAATLEHAVGGLTPDKFLIIVAAPGGRPFPMGGEPVGTPHPPQPLQD